MKDENRFVSLEGRAVVRAARWNVCAVCGPDRNRRLRRIVLISLLPTALALVVSCSYSRHEVRVAAPASSPLSQSNVLHDNTYFRVQGRVNAVTYALLLPTVFGPEAYRNMVEARSEIVDFYNCVANEARVLEQRIASGNGDLRISLRAFRSNYDPVSQDIEIGISATIQDRSGIVLTRRNAMARRPILKENWDTIAGLVQEIMKDMGNQIAAQAEDLEKSQRLVALPWPELRSLLAKPSLDRYKMLFGNRRPTSSDKPIPDSAFNPRRTFAVIVGLSEYAEEKINLRYARGDAERVFQALVNPENKLAIPAENVALLLDKDAVSMRIRAALTVFLEAPEVENVIIFWAGHGGVDLAIDENVQDGIQKYLLPYDVSLEGHLGTTCISMTEVGDYLRKKRMHKVLIALDTCYSGATGEMMMGARSARAIRVEPAEQLFSSIQDAECRVLISACKANQVAKELDKFRSGLFSYYLVDSLVNPNADVNRDGYIDISEIVKYVPAQVASMAQSMRFRQDPIVRVSEASRLDVPVCSLPGVAPAVVSR